MRHRWALALSAALCTLIAQSAQAQGVNPDERAAKALSQMTADEKIQTVFGYFSTDFKGIAKPKEGVPQAAGFLYGVERLGIPHQQLTDAGIGVATQRGDKVRELTSLP
ncbi:MAG: glycosyl hydrolase, partial [Gammaproteobacteria bacterium]